MIKQLVLITIFAAISSYPCFAQNLARFGDIRPGMADKKLEKQAVWLANRRGLNYNWREVYKKAVIISHKWEPELDKDGFMKGRKIHMELYAELPTGRCAMTDFTFRQKVLPDETFTHELYYVSVGDMVYIDCE